MKTLLVILGLFGTAWTHAGTPTVTVHLLDHTDKKQTKSRFWIDWSKKWRGVVTTKTTTDEEATKIIEILRASLTSTEASHFCGHDPIYGIEATDPEGKVLKTSLCFSCLTWVKSNMRMDISGIRGSENKLCKALRAVIEMPQELLDTETKSTPKYGEQGGGGNR